MPAPTQKNSKKRFHGPRRRFRVLLHSVLQNEPLTHAIIEEAQQCNWVTADLRFLQDERVARDFGADGVLSCHPDSPDLLRSLAPCVVAVGQVNLLAGGIPVVAEDYAAVGRLAAEHFLRRGFRHIGGVNIRFGQDQLPHPTLTVGNGFADRLGADGIRPLPPLLLESGSYRTGRERFAAWQEKQPRPLGLLVWRDRTAVSICTWCQELGVAVPEEIALLGMGNLRLLCELSHCPLSSVDTDFPIADVAPMSGFFTRVYLHRAFAKRFGMSPSQYRRRHNRQT